MLREGKCCASALVQLGLETRGQENKQLVEVASALCRGVQSGLTCGALTGAACMLNIIDPGNANTELIPELVEWFKATYGKKYGGISCKEIIGGDVANQTVRCPALIEATFLQAKSILADYGLGFD
ncbi:MAG TPA: C-GCAxxG-C-C family protein [Clostridia bacterium]|nr:C-GCAxxG-C-C family protein [Clostridia bacterium]